MPVDPAADAADAVRPGCARSAVVPGVQHICQQYGEAELRYLTSVSPY